MKFLAPFLLASAALADPTAPVYSGDLSVNCATTVIPADGSIPMSVIESIFQSESTQRTLSVLNVTELAFILDDYELSNELTYKNPGTARESCEAGKELGGDSGNNFFNLFGWLSAASYGGLEAVNGVLTDRWVLDVPTASIRLVMNIDKNNVPVRLVETIEGTELILLLFDFSEEAPSPSYFNVPPSCDDVVDDRKLGEKKEMSVEDIKMQVAKVVKEKYERMMRIINTV
jgi:hypothetical protein